MIDKVTMEQWMARANDRSDPLCGEYAKAVAGIETAVALAFLGKEINQAMRLGVFVLGGGKLKAPEDQDDQQPQKARPQAE